mgnify:FL=1
MRKAKSGTIVNIVSDAALWGMPLAGAAYTVSKFGLRGLTQAINAEENKNDDQDDDWYAEEGIVIGNRRVHEAVLLLLILGVSVTVDEAVTEELPLDALLAAGTLLVVAISGAALLLKWGHYQGELLA